MTAPNHSLATGPAFHLRDLSLRHLRPPRSALMRYAWSVVVWLGAFALTLGLAPYIQRANFVFFWVAVLFAAWYGGLVPALLAAAAAVLAVHYYFIQPAGQLWPIRTPELLTLGIFSAAALLVSVLGRLLRQAYETSRRTLRHAEQGDGRSA